ncbi:MAG: 50S ribosomal protein L9 [Deltaproteobacteria bacterium]|nr:50S ribosomal protein L9 [Deltaproteobacteria bacterium]
MKVILMQDTDSLGLAGEIVEVARGYARNYLIPTKVALEATQNNIKRTEAQRKTIEVKRIKLKEDALKIKERLADVVVTIAQKAGEEEKLYGSVTSMDIAEQLEKQGVTIDRRKIHLDKPIKSLGEFSVPVKLHPQVSAPIKVIVVAEQ